MGHCRSVPAVAVYQGALERVTAPQRCTYPTSTESMGAVPRREPMRSGLWQMRGTAIGGWTNVSALFSVIGFVDPIDWNYILGGTDGRDARCDGE